MTDPGADHATNPAADHATDPVPGRGPDHEPAPAADHATHAGTDRTTRPANAARTSARLPWQTRELTVGQLAERAGVAPSALRYYEREGLIHSRRTAGNQRRYGRDTLRRVAFVRASQRVGMPLAAIRDALALLPEGRTPTREDWARVSEGWREDLNQRIKLLTQLRDHLTECIGCGCLSLDHCALANPHDRLGAEGPGPRSLAGAAEPDGNFRP